MRLRNWIYGFLLFLFIACEKIPFETSGIDLQGKQGVFISCEGNFMYGNASLSFYDKREKKVYNNIFFGRNNTPLGDVAQSLQGNGSIYYIVINNSGKIYGFDPETMEFKGVITGLVSPRYLHFINSNKAYVSDLYAQTISIINQDDFSITGQIDVSDGAGNSGKHSTEQFVQVGQWVFVSCWTNDQYILVIDSETDQVVDSIKTPLQPKDLLLDQYNKIWALCDGGYKGFPLGNETPSLIRIDPGTRTIEQKYIFDEDSGQPSSIAMNNTGDTIYFINKNIYKMHIESRYLPDNIFIGSGDRLFYSMGIDSENNDIYVSDAIDYTQSAIIYRYSVSGILIDTFKTGINPGDYLFK